MTYVTITYLGGNIMAHTYHETYVSSAEYASESEALKVLNSIREAHPARHGWREIRGFVQPLPNGKYKAVREHEKLCND